MAKEMTKARVRIDLEKKVRELMRRAEKNAISKVKTLALAGSGILEEHEANKLNYTAAMEFMAAFADEMRNGHLPSKPDRHVLSRVRNYFILM
jgi:hypothetical protein